VGYSVLDVLAAAERLVQGFRPEELSAAQRRARREDGILSLVWDFVWLNIADAARFVFLRRKK
jgi:hypothetical protein